MLGYAYDAAAGAIRPINGMLGAAVVGDAYGADVALSRAAIAPLQNYALAVAADGSMRIVRGLPDAPALDSLDTAAADQFVFSPSGSAALLYDSASGRLQVLTGLPDSPAARDISGVSPGHPALAVRDDGAAAIGGDDAIRISTPDSTTFLLPVPGAAALAFERISGRLAAVTNSGDVYVAAGVDEGLDLRLAASSAVAGNVIGAQFAPDGSGIVAAAADGSVSMIAIDAGTVQSLNCGCAPTGLAVFGRPGLFRLTDISDRPVMIVDAAVNDPRFWFVPPASSGSAQE